MHLLKKTGKFFIVSIFLMVFFVGPSWLSIGEVYAAKPNEATAEVTATVDRNALNPGDTLTLNVSVVYSGDVSVGQPTLPTLSDFDVLNQWTSQETRATLVTTPSGPQFKTVKSTDYNFLLQPNRLGDLKIGGVEVVVDGKAHMTKPITVKVAKGAGAARPNRQQPQRGVVPPPDTNQEDEDPADALFNQLLQGVRRQQQPGGSRTLPMNPNDAFFVQLDADKTEAYVGEQITASFYLYTRGIIRDLDTLKYPTLRGFWKEDIEIATQLNFQSEVVNGLPYKKALLTSYALFPIKDGSATIDSYQAKASVIASVDPLSGLGFGKAYTYTKVSTPLKITIKPLPTEGRPADFSGAVGDFTVSTRVEDKNIVANQPFTLKIRFEGKGNAKTIELPPFTPPDGLEIYNTTAEAKFFRTGTSYKDFSILLIPRREGDFLIPPLSASVFDPSKKRYVTHSTEQVRVHVGPAAAGGPQTPNQNLSALESDSKPKVDSAPLIQPEYRASFTPSLGQELLWAALGLTGVGALLLWRAKIEFGWGEKKKTIERQWKVRLKKVEAKIEQGNWRGVGVEMTNAVYFVLGEISGEGGAHVELEKMLMKSPPSVRRELGGAIRRQMETFQILSFAPDGVVGDLKKPEILRGHVNEMKKLMEQTVSLAMSSEQSTEPEEGPLTS
jgi:hypothetical protein